MIASRRIKRYLFILILLSILSAQKYDIKFWGLNIGTAEIIHDSNNEIKLTLKSLDIINNLYPLEFEYYSKYSEKDFLVIESNKITRQGNNKLQYSAEYLDSLVVYNNQDSIVINKSTFSFLSLIEKIINTPIDSVDTKWYSLENEGNLHKARPLWNDTTTVKIENVEYLCDNYRIDLKLIDDDNKLFTETDYFNELFFDINSIRQLWVEKWQKQRRLVKISVKSTLIHLEIVMQN